MEVQVSRIDAEAGRELAVGERLVLAVRPERFEDAQPEGMAERLQLLGLVEQEDVNHPGRLGRCHSGSIYTPPERPSAIPWSQPRP